MSQSNNQARSQRARPDSIKPRHNYTRAQIEFILELSLRAIRSHIILQKFLERFNPDHGERWKADSMRHVKTRYGNDGLHGSLNQGIIFIGDGRVPHVLRQGVLTPQAAVSAHNSAPNPALYPTPTPATNPAPASGAAPGAQTTPAAPVAQSPPLQPPAPLLAAPPTPVQPTLDQGLGEDLVCPPASIVWHFNHGDGATYVVEPHRPTPRSRTGTLNPGERRLQEWPYTDPLLDTMATAEEREKHVEKILQRFVAPPEVHEHYNDGVLVATVSGDGSPAVHGQLQGPPAPLGQVAESSASDSALGSGTAQSMLGLAPATGNVEPEANTPAEDQAQIQAQVTALSVPDAQESDENFDPWHEPHPGTQGDEQGTPTQPPMNFGPFIPQTHQAPRDTPSPRVSDYPELDDYGVPVPPKRTWELYSAQTKEDARPDGRSAKRRRVSEFDNDNGVPVPAKRTRDTLDSAQTEEDEGPNDRSTKRRKVSEHDSGVDQSWGQYHGYTMGDWGLDVPDDHSGDAPHADPVRLSSNAPGMAGDEPRFDWNLITDGVLDQNILDEEWLDPALRGIVNEEKEG